MANRTHKYADWRTISVSSKRHALSFLATPEVKAFAENSAHSEIAWTLVTTGMRFGKLAGLQVNNIDCTKQCIHTDRNAVWVKYELHIEKERTLKTRESRSIAVPGSTLVILTQNVDGRRQDDWVFSGTDTLITPPKGAENCPSINPCNKAFSAPV